MGIVTLGLEPSEGGRAPTEGVLWRILPIEGAWAMPSVHPSAPPWIGGPSDEVAGFREGRGPVNVELPGSSCSGGVVAEGLGLDGCCGDGGCAGTSRNYAIGGGWG